MRGVQVVPIDQPAQDGGGLTPQVHAQQDQPEDGSDKAARCQQGQGRFRVNPRSGIFVIIAVVLSIVFSGGEKCKDVQIGVEYVNETSADGETTTLVEVPIMEEQCEETSSGGGGGGSTSCFAPGTAVLAGDGAWRSVEDYRPGDVVALGGVVEATMRLLGGSEPLYALGDGYDGLVMTGSHAVRDPDDGRWKHAARARGARLLSDRVEPVLHNLITREHLVWLRAGEDGGGADGGGADGGGADGGARLRAADYMEVDDADELFASNLALLNGGGAEATAPAHAEAIASPRSGRRLKSCFPAGAHVLVRRAADGANATKPVEAVALGDELVGGGRVTGTMELLGDGEDLYSVGGAVVSGSHSVRDPSDGVWKHAEHVLAATRLEQREALLYNLISERHRVLLAAAPGETARGVVEAADFLEVDESAELLAQNLAILNEQEL